MDADESMASGERGVKEAIKTLKENCCVMCAYGSQDMESCNIRYCDNRDAIKALEKAPVLDKIRAEIEEHAKINYALNVERAKALCWCLDIINKYKTESEDE